MLAQLRQRTRFTVGLPSLLLPSAQNQGGRAVAVMLGRLRGEAVVAAVWLRQEGSGPAKPDSLTQTARTLLKRYAGSAWPMLSLFSAVSFCAAVAACRTS
jgi:hypothetical protein